MTDLVAIRRRLAELDEAAGCVHPVRLSSQRLDTETGEYWEGAVKVSCKDRRSAVCAACAARYRDDAWHLVVAGMGGGKGVPVGVAEHPMVFATLTAPSFGPVHTHRVGRPCRPRRSDPTCAHGVSLSCTTRHAEKTHLLRAPLCVECFDYEGAVLWNAHLGPLWRRTAQLIQSELGRDSERRTAGTRHDARLSYVKVAEFQRRGLVHLHAVARADGPDGPTESPPEWVTPASLEAAAREAIRRAEVTRVDGGGRVAWGTELDVVALGSTGDPLETARIARYLAKYTVKGSESSGGLARRLGSLAELRRLGLSAHHERLVETAWCLGGRPELSSLRLREHAHTFGFRGHCATKSQRYSTTFGALRAARAAYRRPDTEAESDFRYSGRGYTTPATSRLAEVLAEAARTLPRGVPGAAPESSPQVPGASDQGEQP